MCINNKMKYGLTQDELKELYQRLLFNEVREKNLLGSCYQQSSALASLTNLKLNDLEFGLLCAYFVANDDLDTVEALANYWGKDVPELVVKGGAERYMKLAEKNESAMGSLERLIGLYKKKHKKSEPRKISMDNSENVKQLQHKLLKLFRLKQCAMLKDVTGVEPDEKNLSEMLERLYIKTM